MTFRNVAYLCTNTSTDMSPAGTYLVQGGQPFFDVACIFAANLNGDDPNRPELFFNPGVTEVLTSGIGQIQELQKLGIKVLLTVLNNNQNAGWSNFTDPAAAKSFAGQLADAVEQYGLDGIDIDDEYSTGTPNDTSLIMVTTALQKAMPGKIISKALFADSQYFQASYEGRTLAQNLTFGAEMTYGEDDYAGRLAPYLQYGMAAGDTAIGVTADGGTDGADAATYVKENGVGGIMVYDVTAGLTEFMNPIVEALYGEPLVAEGVAPTVAAT